MTLLWIETNIKINQKFVSLTLEKFGLVIFSESGIWYSFSVTSICREGVEATGGVRRCPKSIFPGWTSFGQAGNHPASISPWFQSSHWLAAQLTLGERFPTKQERPGMQVYWQIGLPTSGSVICSYQLTASNLHALPLLSPCYSSNKFRTSL